MQVKDFLAVTPEDMVLAILKRREKLATTLPKEVEKRKLENDRAYKLIDKQQQTQDEESASPHNDGKINDIHSATQYEENESFRRRTVSRLWIAKYSIEDNAEALEFWRNMRDGAWGHLLEDAERVKNGGPSSYALRKSQLPLEEIK